MKIPFQLFGLWHILALIAAAISMILIVFYAKNKQNVANRRRDVWIFTVVFLLIEIALIVSKIIAKEWSVRYNLPLHLCDFSAITIIFALHTRSKTAFELGYFWGFVGGIMAMLTPNLQFMDWYFVPFFVWHLFLIAGPIYQLFIDNFDIPYKNIYKTMLITVILAGIMHVFNAWLGSNYMFVNEKISSFDALGLPEYPLYMIYLGAMMLVLFHFVWILAKGLGKIKR